MEMFGAPQVEPTLRAQMALGRAASGLGWVAFGALAVGVATRHLWRGRRGPSNGQEPDTGSQTARNRTCCWTSPNSRSTGSTWRSRTSGPTSLSW
jgi:hypothetical protein